MGDLILPQPTRSARYVYEVTGAILESIPGVGTLKKLADIHLNRRIEEALRQIVAEVQESGINILTETQFEFYLPSAYRFAEQVRLGDYEHNLKILRKILIEGLKSHSTDSGKIGRHARQLEYLSEFEIDVLAALHEALVGGVQNANTLFSSGLKECTARFSEKEEISIQNALSQLHARGLLTITGVTWATTENSYSLSPDGRSIIEAAMKN